MSPLRANCLCANSEFTLARLIVASDRGRRRICISRWMQECLDRSRLQKEGAFGESAYIPNGIDTEVFRPGPAEQARRELHLPLGKRIVLFGAHQLDIKTKGADLLMAALALLKDQTSFEVLTFGSGKPPILEGVKVNSSGPVNSKERIRLLYRAADLTLVPSRIEAFGLVAAEAQACGCPVVCFDTTGLRDVVEHKITGYRAECFDPSDFAAGVRWCLENGEGLLELGRRARERALNCFSMDKTTERHIDFYNQMVR